MFKSFSNQAVHALRVLTIPNAGQGATLSTVDAPMPGADFGRLGPGKARVLDPAHRPEAMTALADPAARAEA